MTIQELVKRFEDRIKQYEIEIDGGVFNRDHVKGQIHAIQDCIEDVEAMVNSWIDES